MILNFHDEIDEIRRIMIDIKIPPEKKGIQIAFVLAKIYDAGIANENRRLIKVIQRLAMNPGPIVAAMKRARR